MSIAAPADLLRVVVVDDDDFVARGMARAFRREIELVGQASSGADGASLAAAKSPDVVVMDFQGVRGLWSGMQKITRGLGIPVLMATASGCRPLAERCLEHGASGIAAKGNSEAVVAAMRVVAGGGEHWEEPWGSRVDQLREQGHANQSPPTPEEMRLVNAMGMDIDRAGMQRLFGVSERTIRERVTKLKDRFEVKNDHALHVRLARDGWIDGRNLFDE